MVRSKDSFTLITLNTHALVQPDTEGNINTLAEAFCSEAVSIAALQEVNQPHDAQPVSAEDLRATGFVPAGDDTVREGNYALLFVRRLKTLGVPVYWTWVMTHRSYNSYNEGVALISRFPIDDGMAAYVSKNRDYENWRTRKALGIQMVIGGMPLWFFSVHLGWWGDEDDLKDQLAALDGVLAPLREQFPVYVAGDFNCPAHVRGEGYDMMTKGKRWHDCYARAEERDEGVTVRHQIDGWRDKQFESLRIDYVFASRKGRTLLCRSIFNDAFYPIISDHFGVLVREALPPEDVQCIMEE